MTSRTDPVMHRVQRLIAVFSRSWHAGRRGSRPEVTWVVGPNEIASLVSNLAQVIPGSHSVSLTPHRFYDFDYDTRFPAGRGDMLRHLFVAPWIFGRLAASATGFLYVGADGFLLPIDARDWEFGFLLRHGVKIACVFTGSDIRSPRLMRQFGEESGLETIVTYLDQVAPVFRSPEYDEQRRRIAMIADRHADVVFTAAVDQMSYLERPTEPFPYLLPDELITADLRKHDAGGVPIVLHAPSSPIIKGTQVVRAAVRRLHADGYDFEYRELIGVPHDEVLAELRDAHIVLNEFYAFVPGVFGVEAMASGCALLTSADERIEHDLPAGSNGAWMVTPASDIERNLRLLLDEPHRVRELASAGQEWVRQYATASATGARVRKTLDSLQPGRRGPGFSGP